MKTKFDSPARRSPELDLSACPDSHPAPDCEWMAAPAASCVRIFLGIDVPIRTLPEIKADWALVTATQQDAPDLTPAAVATALGRLQQHAVTVAGVAVVEPGENPFAPWLMPEAAKEAA